MSGWTMRTRSVAATLVLCPLALALGACSASSTGSATGTVSLPAGVVHGQVAVHGGMFGAYTGPLAHHEVSLVDAPIRGWRRWST